MSLPAYPSYRESGDEWLGGVPAHWEVTRLKQVCNVFPSNVDKKTVDGQQAVRLCNYTDVYYNDEIHDALSFMEASATDDQIERFQLRGGDTIFTKDSETPDDIARSAYVPVDLPGVICGYHLSMARPKARTHGAFIKRYFDASTTRAYFHVKANGLTRVGLSQYAVDNAPIALPPLAEQIAIAAFLNRETAKIDTLVEEQRRLIELLNEKRQAVISHAVTKGLNPDAPMKDSGVEWLGEVPANWTVTSVGRLCDQLSYGFTNPMPTSEDGPFMLTANDIGDGQVRFETARRTTFEAFDALLTEKSRPQAGDILLTKDGTLGRIAVFDGTPSCINQSVAFLRPKVALISSNYLAAALADGVYQDRMIYEAGGTTIKHIYISRLAKMQIAIPPLDEMKGLEEFCLAHRAAAEQLSMAAYETVALLQERRAALISAAVTGKIDVRGAVAQQAEAA